MNTAMDRSREIYRTASLRDLAEAYLYAEEDPHLIAEHADQAAFYGNEAYSMIRPITNDMIPVAAAQETPEAVKVKLGRLRYQMIQRRDIEPFSVTLSLNYPEELTDERDADRIRQNVKTVQKFQASIYGHALPLSFFEQAYPSDTTIGGIRRDLANASIQVLRKKYRRTGLEMPERTNLLIGDIDTPKISPGYIPGQQQRIREGFSWACARVRHQTTNGVYPQIDRAIRSFDLTHLLEPRESYDAHSMYSLRTAIAGGLFAPHDKLEEVHRMRRRAEQVLGAHFRSHPIAAAPGAIAISDSRRLVDKLRKGAFLEQLWESGEFGMQDAYREGKIGSGDIPKPFADRFVAENVLLMTTFTRDALARASRGEHGDIPPEIARSAAADHVGRILEVANIRLGLDLGSISVLDAVRPRDK